MEEASRVVGLNLPISIGVNKAIGLVCNCLGRIEIIYPGFDLQLGNFFFSWEVGLVLIRLIRSINDCGP